MKKNGFEADIKVVLQFDPAAVELIRTAALEHYSHDCNEAANCGGFMWGAMNVANWAAEKGEEATRAFSSRELNLMLKMIELHDGAEYNEIRQVLFDAFKRIGEMRGEINKQLENRN